MDAERSQVTVRSELLPAVEKGADLSEDGRYRYRLWRRWGTGPMVTWVMLNPSTADADVDDPTIRRVRWFSEREGFDAFEVLNLFALRSPDPRALGRHMEPVGRDNGEYLTTALAQLDGMVIAAWGAHKDAVERGRRLASSATAIGRALWCLGTTKDGYPRHPLYVPGVQRLEVFCGTGEA